MWYNVIVMERQKGCAMRDPIVESVREARDEHAKKFNYNVHEICEDLRSKQKACGHEVVSLPPKRIIKATGS